MTEWEYEPSGDFDKTPIERLRTFPRHPDMWVYAMRFALHAFMRVWLRVYHRYQILGREHLPDDEPFVMVANHASHLDAISLLSALPLRKIQKAYPAAAKDYFFTTLPKIAFSAIAMNAMPFDRRENPRESLALCRELLATPGHVLILFPEGTRTATGEMATFKPGVGFLTAGTPVRVVPCYLDGAFRAWPKGAWIPRPRKLTLRIGAPMSFADLPQDKEGAKGVAARLEETVRAIAATASSAHPRAARR
ncbi:MAG TPA: lysophospholipid acyltransferase family protein [Thermoanaerobaculia bacterium]|nr:lysophospholipid acyltransferase family protein [Thermoanaerobaculia bacterium]